MSAFMDQTNGENGTWLQGELIRVEAPITNHLRNYAPGLKKYKVVQKKFVQEDETQDDSKLVGKFVFP